MNFFVGTSGYSYKEWKGPFYPAKLPANEWLHYYAQRLSTVEINNTHYRFPTREVVETWAQQTPGSFRFALKAHQTITHRKRLKGVENNIEDFLAVTAPLEERRGPWLLQLPPNFQKDLAKLDNVFAIIAGRAQVAFEFRHESWFDEEVFDCLRTHSCALCTADGESDADLAAEAPASLVGTADWGYLRLRRPEYSADELRVWIDRIRSFNWREAYVFFKHEDAGAGPKLAARFLELL